MARTVITKEALLAEINRHLESLPACRNLHISKVIHDPARSHGANWTTHGLQRSGSDHDEVECQEAIADYMAALQERYDILDA